jgi:hypothetical protein
MRKVTRAVGLLCLVSCIAVPAVAGENEVLHFELGLDWIVVRNTERHGHVVIEYLRRGDDLNNWKELLTYNNGRRSRGERSPEEEVNTLEGVHGKAMPRRIGMERDRTG